MSNSPSFELVPRVGCTRESRGKAAISPLQPGCKQAAPMGLLISIHTRGGCGEVSAGGKPTNASGSNGGLVLLRPMGWSSEPSLPPLASWDKQPTRSFP